MFRILRKYSAWILGIGGTLLLIAFLAPQALQEFAVRAGQQNATEATVGPENTKVRAKEWSEAVMQVGILDRLQNLTDQPLRFPLIGTVTDPAHWFLLVREAEALGLVGSPYANTENQEIVTQFAAATGVPTNAVYQTISRVDGIQRMLSFYLDGTKISDNRLITESKKILTEAEIAITIIKKNNPTSPISFSEESMEKQLNEWANNIPNQESPFGYQLADRIQLNWFKIDSENIRSSVIKNDSKSGSLAQRKFWRLNESNPEYPSPEDTSEIPEIVKEDLIASEQELMTSEIKRFITDKLRAPRRGIESKNGFFELPQDWSEKRVKFDVLKELIEKNYNITSSKTFSNDSLIQFTELDSELITSKSNQYGREIGLIEFLRSAKELGGNGIYPVQEGLTLPLLEDSSGSIFVVRINKLDKRRAPNNVDEARENIVKDLNLIAGYEELKIDLEKIESIAKESGLVALADKYDSSVEKIKSLSRFRNLFAGFGNAQDTDQLAQGYAFTFAQLASNNQPLEELSTPISSLGSSPKTVNSILNWASSLSNSSENSNYIKAWAVDEKYAVIVVELQSLQPPTFDIYRKLLTGSTGLLPRVISYKETAQFKKSSDAFSLEALSKRNNFTRNSSSDLDENIN